MAQYTVEIRELINNNVELFDFEYPIFEESYRPILEQRIIDYFYFREIGFESVGRFKFYLRATMQRIMPYYNDMYKSTLLKFDPLLNYQVKEVYKRLTSSDDKRLYSDTPQGRINLTGSDHLTDLTENTGNNSEDFERTMEGNIGVMNYSTLLRDFRDTFLRVDDMLLNELNKLFMGVY